MDERVNMEQNELRKLQLTELEVLKYIRTVCKANGLRYYLVGGTLLGAVRHNGFIPWDDDLDIAMLRKDYDRFLELCKKGALGENFYLHHTITDSEYWLPFAKVKVNNTLFDEESYSKLKCHKGIFIDIFPLDYCPKNKGLFYHARAKIIKKISYVILIKKLNKIAPDFTTKMLYALTRRLSIKRLSNFRDKLCSRYSHGKYIINYGSNYKYTKQTMPSDYYEPATQLVFENELFSVPNQYIKYLEQLFNDWKKLPSEEERRNHNPARVIFDTSMKGKQLND